MQIKILLSILSTGLTIAWASPHLDLDFDRAWMGVSNPLIMSTSFQRHFNALPLRGTAKDPQKFWSSDYWARYKGGINYRWNSSRPTGFNLNSPTKYEATQMSESQLRALAPSEKWDLFIGRYDYPTKKEVARYASPNRPTWEGICDGWAGAAMNHDEPRPVTMTNPDGIRVPFGSSDIKGLLSWYYAKKFADGHSQMGRRCYRYNPGRIDRCTHDLNAGAFHIVFANKLGITGDSFIADLDSRAEVWNHIAYKFRSTIRYSNLRPSRTSAPGTVKRVRIRSVVSYVFLLRKNSWYPVLGTSRQRYQNRTYEYYLDLDASGRIIGGDWISRQRPDFLWLSRAARFRGIYARLPELLDERPVNE